MNVTKACLGATALLVCWQSAAVAHNCYGPPPWSATPIYGSQATFFADMTGDGVADSIAVNNEVMGGGGTAPLTVTVHFGMGWSGGFAPEEHLFATLPNIPNHVFVGDVTGGGVADLVYVLNNRFYVQSAPTPAGAPVAWTTDLLDGTLFLADVDNDQRDDLVAIQAGGIRVRRSTGTSFGPVETWMAFKRFTPLPEHGWSFADLTGDGRADAIMIYDSYILIRRSTGASFGIVEQWTTGPYYGSYGTYFADVTGDNKADAIVIGPSTGVVVRRSTGTSFDPNELWLAPSGFDPPSPWFPTFYFAPVTNPATADLILVTLTGLQGRPNMGTHFLCNWD